MRKLRVVLLAVATTITAACTGTVNGPLVTPAKPAIRSGGSVNAAHAQSPLWQIGDSWVVATGGQCGFPTFPTPTSADFVLVRNGTRCERNQLNPVRNGGNGVYRLNGGQVYTWRFVTVTHMKVDHGRHSQRLVFQIHQYACGLSPNTVLGIENLKGTQVWYIRSDGKAISLPYREGATDSWRFTARIAGDASGTEKWWHNGVLVANTSGSNFTCGRRPFWNFGPYMWNWAGQGGGISKLSRVEILFRSMQLTSP